MHEKLDQIPSESNEENLHVLPFEVPKKVKDAANNDIWDRMHEMDGEEEFSHKPSPKAD